MYGRAAKDHSDPGGASIDLRDHLCFLVRCASDNEDNNILRLVACRSAAFNKRVLLFFQPCFDEILKCSFQTWGMLSVDIFDPFETSESVARSRKNGGGFEEISKASGRGWSLKRVMVGKKLGHNFYLVRRDVASGSEKIKKKREGVRGMPLIAKRVKGYQANFAFLFDLRRLYELLYSLWTSQQ